ncbi:MAG: NAD(P)-binding domain-containing protein [Bdellovibrionales bacterium]|nr:NAD(P)-binding domain-containing protein [Bdellovibrionales bacterium]
MKVGILGSGMVGNTLTEGFKKHGYEVQQGSRDKFSSISEWADLVVLAVKGSAAKSALELAGANNLKGKTVIDATNPISDDPPQDGVLNFFTDMNLSLMETLQDSAPDADFVKAFSCVGSAFMVNPEFDAGKPTMFLCGNNDSAKSNVSEVLDKFGWETEDMGTAKAARAIEPLCMLWCIPGFKDNQWSHAFKLLKK